MLNLIYYKLSLLLKTAYQLHKLNQNFATTGQVNSHIVPWGEEAIAETFLVVETDFWPVVFLCLQSLSRCPVHYP